MKITFVLIVSLMATASIAAPINSHYTRDDVAIQHDTGSERWTQCA